MAGGMLVHQLSVLVVIANGMRLLRVPKAVRRTATGQETQASSAARVAAARA
jgi:Cd2+/Zn2+-exporting ATPase